MTSTAIPRLRPGTFFAASLPVVAAGTPFAARTLSESITTADGSSARPARSRTWVRSSCMIVSVVPSSRHSEKWCRHGFRLWRRSGDLAGRRVVWGFRVWSVRMTGVDFTGY
jgi:hypothetical protein